MSNYPADIRNYDHDPRSPFYNAPVCPECGEEEDVYGCEYDDCKATETGDEEE
jgi:hypothetical protein